MDTIFPSMDSLKLFGADWEVAFYVEMQQEPTFGKNFRQVIIHFKTKFFQRIEKSIETLA